MMQTFGMLAVLISGCSPSMRPLDDPGDTGNDSGNRDTGDGVNWPDPVISCTAANAEMGIEPAHPAPREAVAVWVTADKDTPTTLYDNPFGIGLVVSGLPLREGWGFFQAYDRSGPGLAWWQSEVAAAGVDGKPVLITETGWTTEGGAFGSRADVAAWMLLAWQNNWFSDPRLEAAMPIQLQDGAWDGFSWIQTSGAHYPVFDTIRDWRCSMAFPTSC